MNIIYLVCFRIFIDLILNSDNYFVSNFVCVDDCQLLMHIYEIHYETHPSIIKNTSE